jgi:hypothetical protein
MQKINAFIPYTGPGQAKRTVEELKRSTPVHIGEYLCTGMEENCRTSGEKLFDYSIMYM